MHIHVAFGKTSPNQLVYVSISYNTSLRDDADLYARGPRGEAPEGGVLINQRHPEKEVL